MKRGVRETIGFLYGNSQTRGRPSSLSLAVNASLGPPLFWGVPGGGSPVVGLSAACLSSGVPVLHVSSLWVPLMGISVGSPVLGLLLWESLV